MLRILIPALASCLLAEGAAAQSRPETTHRVCLVQRGAFTAGIFLDYANGSPVGHASSVPGGQERCFAIHTWASFQRAVQARVSWFDGRRSHTLCEFRFDPPFRDVRIITTGTTVSQGCTLE